MLMLPLWGICATALLSIFFPWLKELQHPSIAAFHIASHTSQGYFRQIFSGKEGSRLEVSGDAGHVVPPSESSGLPHLLPLPVVTGVVDAQPRSFSNEVCSILTPTLSSVLVSVTEDSPSPSVVTSPLSLSPTLRADSRDIQRYSQKEDIIRSIPTPTPENVSNSTSFPNELKVFFVLMLMVLGIFHLIVICSWIRISSKKRMSVITKPTESGKIQDLSKSKVVLPMKTSETYLENILNQTEASKPPSSNFSFPPPPPLLPSSGSVQCRILERLYIEEEQEGSAEPRLFSEKRWTISKSEFDSTYVWRSVPQFPSVDPSTVVPNIHVERPPDTDEGTGIVLTDSIGDNKTPDSPSTVVPDRHVEGASESDSGTPVEPKQEFTDPSAVVPDIHVEGPPDVKESTGVTTIDTGSAPEEPIVGEDEKGDGYESSSTSIKASTQPPPLSSPPLEEEADAEAERIREGLQKVGESSTPSSPATIAAQKSEHHRRRRNRMGQRQRRKLRQMREEAEAEAEAMEVGERDGEGGEGEGEENPGLKSKVQMAWDEGERDEC